MPASASIPRPEHPRPDFVRNTFYNLNGKWQFAFDDDDLGLKERWQDGKKLPKSIVVPFCYQSEKSGLGGDEIHPILWYRRSFTVPKDMQGQRVLLRFGAVDYACDVYVNGAHVGHHVGGYSPFAIDVTLALQDGSNDLCLRVTDYPDCTQPRGKQYWKRGLMGCWYTPTSGIWQTVYLEAVGARHLTQIHVTPDIDRQMATAELALDVAPLPGTQVELTLSFGGETLRTLRTDMPTRHMRVPFTVLSDVGLRRMHLWSPGSPNLYDLTVRVLHGDS
ncbi:MAG: glycoside hydrolase family 2, partial [Clostridiales bacterium]|nr:glycoside hydrolase family 2 [Clostridiales bacterium]